MRAEGGVRVAPREQREDDAVQHVHVQHQPPREQLVLEPAPLCCQLIADNVDDTWQGNREREDNLVVALPSGDQLRKHPIEQIGFLHDPACNEPLGHPELLNGRLVHAQGALNRSKHSFWCFLVLAILAEKHVEVVQCLFAAPLRHYAVEQVVLQHREQLVRLLHRLEF